MPIFTINLTEEQAKALEKMYDTDDLQYVLQKNIEVTADNYILEQYRIEVATRPVSELKKIVPDFKVERVNNGPKEENI